MRQNRQSLFDNILTRDKSNQGFSLIEAIIAILVLSIGLLGVFAVFTYATIYNTGNNDRSQAMSVMQRQVELYRSYRFSRDETLTDARILGGVKAAETATSEDGSSFTVYVTIDNYPFGDGSLDNDESSTTFKEIKIQIEQNTNYAWAKSLPVEAIFRRTRSN